MKSCAAEPVFVIPSINPNMITLSENFFTLFWISDTEILERFVDFLSFEEIFYWNKQDCESPRAKDPVELPHGLVVIFNMLKDMGTEDNIKAIVFE